MCEKIFIGISISVVAGVILALILWLGGGGKAWWDKRKVYQWLKDKTSDTLGNSHVSTIKIAQETGLSEERVRKACVSNKIYRHLNNNEEEWSVWREEPQSVYDDLTKEEMRKKIRGF